MNRSPHLQRLRTLLKPGNPPDPTTVSRISRSAFVLSLLLSGIAFYLLWFGMRVSDDAFRTPYGRMIVALGEYMQRQTTASGSTHTYPDVRYGLYLLVTVLLSVLFSLLFLMRSTRIARRWQWLGAAMLLVQMAIGLWVTPKLVYVLVVELALVLPPVPAIGWIAALASGRILPVLMFAATAAPRTSPGLYVVRAVDDVLLYALVFAIALLATSERRARARLQAAHAELLATQSLLTDTVRASERMRISRDLHDSIGHHLTALNLHLELAMHQSSGAPSSALLTSRELSQSLLGSVRMIVSSARSDSSIDLERSLELLCAGIPTPRIELRTGADLHLDSAAAAHTLFSCIQESISNAVRHSRARQLRIEVERRDSEIVVIVEDDGQGMRDRREGNGLRGMRERLAQLGGELVFGDRPQGGFSLRMWLPAAELPR